MTLTPADRRKMTRALAASAAGSPDGLPVYAAVARATGRSRSALRDHWTALGTKGQAAAVAAAMTAPDPEEAPEAPPAKPPAATDDLLAWAARRLGQQEPDAMAEALAELRVERDACVSDTARAQLTKEIAKRTNDWRTPGGGGGTPTPDEWVAQARQAPELLLEACLGCPEVLEDERLWDAVDAAKENA